MSANGRLSSRKITVTDDFTVPDGIVNIPVPSMTQAVERYRERFKLKPWRKHAPEYDIPPAMLGGDNQLPGIMDMADKLIDDAMLIDSRLAKKSAWVHAEEGIDADVAMLASGDERPFLDRRKLRLDGQASNEPVRIVISTDSKDVSADRAAAFIAAAKLAQQFRPLEVWWQGAWLHDAWRGHVFHVPLIQGDMDFSRLQFVLAHPRRDGVSYSIMVSHAYPAKQLWKAGVGGWSYLPNAQFFVPETGIRARDTSVARTAAEWAGLPSLYSEEGGKDSAALQYWRPPEQATPYVPPTEAERRKSDREYEKRQRENERFEKEKEKERISHVA